MDELNRNTVRHLRRMALAGDAPSRILHELVRRLGPARPHPVTLINYMRDAFRLSLQQVKPVAGWASRQAGLAEGLSDAELDEFVAPEITKNRPAWEQPEAEAQAR